MSTWCAPGTDILTRIDGVYHEDIHKRVGPDGEIISSAFQKDNIGCPLLETCTALPEVVREGCGRDEIDQDGNRESRPD